MSETTEKIKLNEANIFTSNFRYELKNYSIEEIEEYVSSFGGLISDIAEDKFACALTYLTEKKGEYTIEKNGRILGCYLKKGILTIKGSSKDYVGMWLNGGKVIVHGSLGDNAGYAIKNGSLFIGGNSGECTGDGMSGDSIIVGGNCGKKTGKHMLGGNIICFGKVESVHKLVQGGIICAESFGEVPEYSKKYVCDLKTILGRKKIWKNVAESFGSLFEEYERLPENLQKKVDEVIVKRPDIFYQFANNNRKVELISGLAKIEETEVRLGYEKSSKGVW